MNCREFREQIYEVAFGEAERSPSFEQHLAGCGDCREEFEVAAFSASGIAATPPPPAPSLSTERLRTAILSENLRRKPSWIPRLSFAGAAAALALAAWFGFNQPSGVDPSRDVAIADNEPIEAVPRGAIVIPEDVPETMATEPESATTVAASEPAPERPTRRTQRRNPRSSAVVVASADASPEVPDDLLAVVVGGAESALDAEFTPMARSGAAMAELGPEGMAAAPAPATSVSEEKPIIVIQPKGQASERSSDDVPIGG